MFLIELSAVGINFVLQNFPCAQEKNGFKQNFHPNLVMCNNLGVFGVIFCL